MVGQTGGLPERGVGPAPALGSAGPPSPAPTPEVLALTSGGRAGPRRGVGPAPKTLGPTEGRVGPNEGRVGPTTLRPGPAEPRAGKGGSLAGQMLELRPDIGEYREKTRRSHFYLVELLVPSTGPVHKTAPF